MLINHVRGRAVPKDQKEIHIALMLDSAIESRTHVAERAAGYKASAETRRNVEKDVLDGFVQANRIHPVTFGTATVSWSLLRIVVDALERAGYGFRPVADEQGETQAPQLGADANAARQAGNGDGRRWRLARETNGRAEFARA
jgi:hypothetical protein